MQGEKERKEKKEGKKKTIKATWHGQITAAAAAKKKKERKKEKKKKEEEEEEGYPEHLHTLGCMYACMHECAPSRYVDTHSPGRGPTSVNGHFGSRPSIHPSIHPSSWHLWARGTDRRGRGEGK